MSRRIALVEDEPALRDNVADALRRHGYDVAAYGGRGDALTAFRARLPDLALIDIGLADDVDGGFALCRELRALSATLPIIFLSALTTVCGTSSRLIQVTVVPTGTVSVCGWKLKLSMVTSFFWAALTGKVSRIALATIRSVFFMVCVLSSSPAASR